MQVRNNEVTESDPRVERIVALGFLPDWAVRSVKVFEAAGLIVAVPDEATVNLVAMHMAQRAWVRSTPWEGSAEELWGSFTEKDRERWRVETRAVVGVLNPIGLAEQ